MRIVQRNSDMVAHLWANQSQEESRCGNVSHAGRDFSSYNTIVASIVDAPSGECVALFTAETYSNTTSKHVCMARWAANHLTSYTVPYVATSRFYNNGLGTREHSGNVEYLLREFREQLQRWLRATSEWRRSADRLEDIRDAGETARKYAAAFGIPFTADIDAEVDAARDARAVADARRNSPAGIRRRERDAAYRQRRKEREKERERARRISEIEGLRAQWDAGAFAAYGDLDGYAATATHIAAGFARQERGGYDGRGWYTCRALQEDVYNAERRARHDELLIATFGDLDSVAAYLAEVQSRYPVATPYESELAKYLVAFERRADIAAWRMGKPASGGLGGLYDVPTMLRRAGDMVQTSRGAEVPITHARRVYRAVVKCRETGEEFRANGHTLHVGAFTVSRITPDGELTVGCHVISWEEIDTFARAQGWAAETETGAA